MSNLPIFSTSWKFQCHIHHKMTTIYQFKVIIFWTRFGCFRHGGQDAVSTGFNRFQPISTMALQVADRFWNKLIVTMAVQVVGTSGNRLVHNNVATTWWKKTCYKLMSPTTCQQLVPTTLIRLVVNKLDTSCSNNLLQVCKPTSCNKLDVNKLAQHDKSTSLLQAGWQLATSLWSQQLVNKMWDFYVCTGCPKKSDTIEFILLLLSTRFNATCN